MKSIKTIYYSSCILAFILLTAFAPFKTNTKAALGKDDQCGEWQKDASSDFQFRNCHEDDDVNFITFQLYNPYNVEVHVFVHLTYTNGTENTYGIYVDADHQSDKLSTNHRHIQDWEITKKQRKNSDDNWEDF